MERREEDTVDHAERLPPGSGETARQSFPADARTTNSFPMRVRALAASSGIYFVGDALIRGASVLLVPLYTRVLTPADYGVLAITASVTVALTLVLNFSLDSAITRLHFETSGDERRRLYGTILLFLLVVSTTVTVGIDLLGMAGQIRFFEAVPYDPFLRLALWTAYFGTITSLPVAIYTARQLPGRVLALTLSSLALQIVLTVILVVLVDQGVIGVLRAALIAAATVAAVSLVLTIRMSSFGFSKAHLLAALAFGLPLLPNNVAHWLLQLSDRLILEHQVPTADLGLYSLAYSVGAVALLFVMAFTRAVGPVMIEQLKDPGSAGDVPRLGTYALVTLAAGCLGLALLGGEVIRVLTPAEYHDAGRLVPLIAFGHLWLVVYAIVSQGLWFSMRTIPIAVVTMAAALIHVVLVLALVPSVGTMAGAVATFAGFAFLAVAQGIVAARVHRIAWEYGRWAKAFAVTAGCFGVGSLAATGRLLIDVPLKLATVGVLFPVGLICTRFWTAGERAWVRERAARLRGRVGRPLRPGGRTRG